jgi:hypothetical protein
MRHRRYRKKLKEHSDKRKTVGDKVGDNDMVYGSDDLPLGFERLKKLNIDVIKDNFEALRSGILKESFEKKEKLDTMQKLEAQKQLRAFYLSKILPPTPEASPSS